MIKVFLGAYPLKANHVNYKKNMDVIIKVFCFYVLLNKFLSALVIPIAKIVIRVAPNSKLIKAFVKIYWAGENIGEVSRKIDNNSTQNVNSILESGFEVKETDRNSINKTFITTINLIKFIKKRGNEDETAHIALKS